MALIDGTELGQYSIVVIRHYLQLPKPTMSRIAVGPKNEEMRAGVPELTE